jgi:hypothetical protein
MKVTIPLDSTLSTDSHPNDIKDPSKDRDLFNKNRSYLYNKHLTNPKKKVIDSDGYITTDGDIIQIVSDGENTHIYHNGVIIADVLSLGIEDTSFLDKDDAVIDNGFLWTVQRTLSGYLLEQTDLQTQEITSTGIEQEGVDVVRFVRNTHKVITKNQDGSVTIDSVNYNSTNLPGLSEYFANFNGELAAVEVNGKIWFGYNNPAGSNNAPLSPPEIINLFITEDVNNWRLAPRIPDQDKNYIINITVSDNVRIGSGNSFDAAMDLLTGVRNPLNHVIFLNLGKNVLISGRGGDGGSVANPSTFIASSGILAIRVGSNINITGDNTAVIQGGGGGGGAARANIRLAGSLVSFGVAGGGGAGIPPGAAGTAVGFDRNSNGQIGTDTDGGDGGFFNADLDNSIHAGKGGDGGMNGDLRILHGSSWENTTITFLQGFGANAISITRPAICVHSGITLRGGIASV